MPKADMTFRGALSSDRKWSKAAVAVGGVVLLAASVAVVSAQGSADPAAQAQSTAFSLGKVFTFLFMTLGPFKIFGPFA